MKKIPLIFLFDHDARKMTEEINPVAQWVFDGEGVATRKYDGTACATCRGIFMKRRTVKSGKQAPRDFMLVKIDSVTGKQFGWVLVEESDKYHQEAYLNLCDERGDGPEDGTYELIGPKVQGNPERQPAHMLIKHSEAEQYSGVLRTYDGLREWLTPRDIEGLVFHHIDGRMAKIRKKDFGLSR